MSEQGPNMGRRRFFGLLAGATVFPATTLGARASELPDWKTTYSSKEGDEKIYQEIKLLADKVLDEFKVVLRYDFDFMSQRDQFGNKVELEGLKNPVILLEVMKKLRCYLCFFPPKYFKERKDALMSVNVGTNVSLTKKTSFFGIPRKNTDAVAISDERDSFYIDVNNFILKDQNLIDGVKDFDRFTFHEIMHNIFPHNILSQQIWEREIVGQLTKMGLNNGEIIEILKKNAYDKNYRNSEDYDIDRQYGFARNYGKEKYFEDFCTVFEILMSPKSNSELVSNFGNEEMALYKGDVLLKAKVEAAKVILPQALDLDADYWEDYKSRTFYRNGDEIDPVKTSEAWMKYWAKKGKL